MDIHTTMVVRVDPAIHREVVVEPDLSRLKEEINNFLWCHLPSDTTIAEAERVACVWFDVFQKSAEETRRRNEKVAYAPGPSLREG